MEIRPIVSIIIPVFNEEAIIRENLLEISKYTVSLNQKYDFEIIVVNDGSSDNTGRIAEELVKDHPKIKIFHHLVNLNLGNALKTGFLHANGTYAIVMDIDLSYDVGHIEKLLSTIVTTQADLVLASPYMPGGKVSAVPALRRILSKGANRFLRLCAQEKFYTYTGMVRAYRTEFIKGMNLKTKDYEISAEILYKSMILRGRIIEIPAHLDWSIQNKHKESRTSGIRLFRSFMSSLMSGFIYRPYVFFLGIGTILLIISLYMLIWVLIHTFSVMPLLAESTSFFDDRFSRAVAEVFRDRPHSFFVGGVLLFAAVQFFSLGFIALQNKRYFEELFHISTNINNANIVIKNRL